METVKINTQTSKTQEIQKILLGAVAPRPIALASTIDANGKPNLSPFSFFNVFSANPPIAIFSPARRIRDNTTKHTLENIKKTKEVVINVVTRDIVEKVSLSSCEYDKGVNEFLKAGLQAVKSETIKPFRVKESPISFECKVKEVISLGEKNGAGNLIICEIKMIHIKKDIINNEGDIDRKKINLVGRLNGNWYCETNFESLFEVAKPNKKLGIGVDNIPDEIKNNSLFDENDIGKLGNIDNLPTKEDVSLFLENNIEINQIIKEKYNHKKIKIILFEKAKEFLQENEIKKAWNTLLIESLIKF
ncbi:MAG: flavin reductase [Flavobacteriales bacterium]|nr:flavin reductase [Flavobacteriales bacterium]|tara:strand:- start:309 stop:1220 length:912 start_codon:yes stop_codon:yes gene_type:complete